MTHTQSQTMPSQKERADAAVELMEGFLHATGVTSEAPARRYLWTDAFAVCNLLEFGRAGLELRGGDATEVALRLVEQVHSTLGRHRSDDPRQGWISGLSEDEGERHPTLGGLRIGKKLPERGPSEPFDSRREWDRDGQYFHYLTKWMHALLRVARETGSEDHGRWAAELARTAHDAFTFDSPHGGRRRMVWKMSIALDRPLVPSMGQHDPLDGYVTYSAVESPETPKPDDAPSLRAEIGEMAEIAGIAGIGDGGWATDDPLGLGGLLGDALRVGRLLAEPAPKPDAGRLRHLLEGLLESAATGLEAFARQGHLDLPSTHRLAFRELGLAIGLHGAEDLARLAGDLADEVEAMPGPTGALERILDHRHLGREIEAHWLDPDHRRPPSWTDHADINTVMLATSLVPRGFLRL